MRHWVFPESSDLWSYLFLKCDHLNIVNPLWSGQGAPHHNTICSICESTGSCVVSTVVSMSVVSASVLGVVVDSINCYIRKSTIESTHSCVVSLDLWHLYLNRYLLHRSLPRVGREDMMISIDVPRKASIMLGKCVVKILHLVTWYPVNLY